MLEAVLLQAQPLVERIPFLESVEFLGYQVLGNSLLGWAAAAMAGLLAFFVLRIAVRILAGRAEAVARHTSSQGVRLAADLLGEVKGPVYLVLAIWVGTLFVTLTPVAQGRISTLVMVVLLIQFALWGVQVVNWGLERYQKRQMDEDPATATAIGAMGFIFRVAIWSIIGVMALSTMGWQVGPLLAGMGVGGIAVALALQNVLGDLFASLSIVFDRPFVIGDFIIVGELMGTVEHVGLKTTRIRSLSGEQLIFSNSDLLSSRVRNFKRMEERRVLFHFGVQYDTGHDKVKRIPEMVRKVVEGQDLVRFDRAHFQKFGNSSLDFEVVYFMLKPDYNTYMDVQQAINLELYRIFEEEGIQFAFPTRTLHLHIDGAEAPVAARVVPQEAAG